MGTIARFDLADLHRRFGVRHFVETGTGKGDSLAHAETQLLFRTLLSCEIDMGMADNAMARFENEPRVRIFNEKSLEFLDWVSCILPHDESILFWLDAHFPGADQGFGGQAGFGDEKDESIRLPLENELKIIGWNRPNSRDVIICDDLRIYTDGPFQSGNVPADVRPFCPKERNIDFVHRLMDATHDVQELYEHEGYILITPKESP